MTARVTLSAVRQFPGGYSAPSITQQVGDVEYTLPLPFQEVTDLAAIYPAMEPTEDGSAISMRLDRWLVVHLQHGTRLPLLLSDMATAARAAREFEREAGISWTSDWTELESWATSWIHREQEREAGER